ncbi:hypothetical protein, partial [Myroides sp. WP-1]|uniref:hypothetical protein n=1 Tax=Myroides sp. WP-1 TaxID=2759944 RepID=UPI0017F55A23
GVAKVCETCGAFLSMLEWLPPLEINVSKRKLGDFIYGTYVGFIVSKKVKDKIDDSDFNGLTNFREVKLYYKDRLLNEVYYYPEIKQVNAYVDLSYIEFEEKNLCNTCQKGKSIIKKINAIVFESPNQISSDVFYTTAIGQAVIIVSDYCNVFFQKEKFTNIEFLDASKFKWDCFNPIY